MRRGFTLVECAVSLIVLAIMLVGIMVSYRSTVDGVAVNVMRERAMAVAQRQMENLMASLQEPNSIITSGEDEYDPLFNWELRLKRELIEGGSPNQDMSNTFIKATVLVDCEDPGGQTSPKVELVRYFAYLKPLPGQTMAVPFEYETTEPQWITDLREKLGREPTSEEIFEEMLKELDLSSEEMEEMESLLDEEESYYDEDEDTEKDFDDQVQDLLN